jgi:hypothetical protein
MTNISVIVEGDGEVQAVPVLLRRLSEWLSPEAWPEINPPIRVRRDRFLNRPDEFSRHLQLAAMKSGDNGWVLVLLDADDDCPAGLGPEVLERARGVIPHRKISVVLANREYETWFIASASSLDGRKGFSCDEAAAEAEPEVPRDAKGWLSERIENGVSRPIVHQPAFSAAMDLELAERRSRSFRKLCSEWRKQFPNVG